MSTVAWQGPGGSSHNIELRARFTFASTVARLIIARTPHHAPDRFLLRHSLLSLLRCDNTFSGRSLQSSRLREVTLCMLLTHHGRSVLCELRVRHWKMAAFHETSEASSHETYLRSLLMPEPLALGVGSNEQLERTLVSRHDESCRPESANTPACADAACVLRPHRSMPACTLDPLPSIRARYSYFSRRRVRSRCCSRCWSSSSHSE